MMSSNMLAQRVNNQKRVTVGRSSNIPQEGVCKQRPYQSHLRKHAPDARDGRSSESTRLRAKPLPRTAVKANASFELPLDQHPAVVPASTRPASRAKEKRQLLQSTRASTI
jgi:hypothetical protein